MVVSTGFLLPTAFLAEKPLSTHHLLTVTGALPDFTDVLLGAQGKTPAHTPDLAHEDENKV
jgi:hypothetical protein